MIDTATFRVRSACSLLDRQLYLLGQVVLCVLLSWSSWTCSQPSLNSKPTWDMGRSPSSLGREVRASAEMGRWAVVYASKSPVVGSWGTGLWGALGRVFTLWHRQSSLHTFYGHLWSKKDCCGLAPAGNKEPCSHSFTPPPHGGMGRRIRKRVGVKTV